MAIVIDGGTIFLGILHHKDLCWNQYNIDFLIFQILSSKIKEMIAPPSIIIVMDELLVENWFKVMCWMSTETQKPPSYLISTAPPESKEIVPWSLDARGVQKLYKTYFCQKIIYVRNQYSFLRAEIAYWLNKD